MNLRNRILLITIPINIIAIISIYIIVKVNANNTIESLTNEYASNLLNSAVLSIKNQYTSLEYHKNYVTDLRKKERQQIIHIAKSIADLYYNDYKSGKLSKSEAQKQAVKEIGKFRYDSGNGYIWINDTKKPIPYVVYHPIFPEFNGKLSDDPTWYTSQDSNNIARLAVEACEQNGSGFINYRWKKPSQLEQENPILKTSYVESYEPWQWILGTGIYLEDIERDVQNRLEAIKSELKQTMGKMKLGKTGYFFIFNSSKELILHPFLENSIPDTVVSYLTRNAPFDDIIKASNTIDKTYTYRWYSPLESGNQQDDYLKRVYVEYFEPLDWYVCASFYYSELEKPGILLGQKILFISAIFIAFSLIAIFHLSNTITKPLNQLIKIVSQISKNFQEANLNRFPYFKTFEANALSKVIKEMLKSIKVQHNSFIQERNKAMDNEARMRDSEIKFRTLFESSNDAILLIRENKIINCNQRTLELFKCKEYDIINKSPAELSPKYQFDGKLSIQKVQSILEKTLNGTPQFLEWNHQRLDGEVFIASISLNIIELGSERYVQASVRDITERKNHEIKLEEYRVNLEKMVDKRTLELNQSNELLSAKNEILEKTLHDLKEAQSQLLQSEKMASLGILTAGVAHEINNPLNFVQNGTFALQTTIDTDTPQYKGKYKPFFDAINVGIDRITNIVKSLSRYSRSQKTSKSLCNLNEIINNCLTMLQNKYKNRIVINKDYLKNIPLINANEGELHQVFLNILLNAVQAIPGKGQVYIKTEMNDSQLQITVTDNGVGIKQEDLKYLFDPFYTTKEPGKGTGLGLSIAEKLIKDHKGTIECNSVIENGSSFIINLPVK